MRQQDVGFTMFIQFIEKLGALAIWVLRIPAPVPHVTEEMSMQPSEGRTYINFDNYDVDRLQRNRSEHSEG